MDYGKEYREKLARACRRLRGCHLIKHPFTVRMTEESSLPKDTLGDYSDGLVRIRRKLPGYVARDILLHELAHHISTHEHGVEWAQAYSDLYQWYVEGFGNEEQE